MPDRPWHLELRPRGDSGILSFAWPDTPYAILLLLDTDGSPRGWYVNLQTPLARTPIGFDTVDHALDVLVALDRSSWTWKDEDELAEAIALGLFTEADAASFRYWGERAVEHLVLRQPPFDDGRGRTGGPIRRGRCLSFHRGGTSSERRTGRDSLPHAGYPSSFDP